ncbi:hypothetical protein [Pseudomonas sp. 18083194]|uniref:hypothetical protein n=1 Tax=Pseudomonas sp. 18083194 TaxID=2952250 RepID=UPI00215764A0|nr:hypothetical protein [Pseudomonas sp. 18083194]
MNKVRERYLLELFIQELREDIEVIDDQGEEPDFIVRSTKGIVGIEVSEVFVPATPNGTFLQQEEGLAEDVIKKTHKIYKEKGAPPVSLKVLFKNHVNWKTINRKKLAENIALFLEEPEFSLENYEWINGRLGKYKKDLYPLVSLRSHPVLSWKKAIWLNVGSLTGWVHEYKSAPFQDCIDQKSKRLKSYRARAKENWLLMVTNGVASQFIDPPKPEQPLNLSSPFERTFCYWRFRSHLRELANDVEKVSKSLTNNDQ